MDRVVRHVEIERAVVSHGLLHGGNRLTRQGLGKEGARLPILLQPGYGEEALRTAVGIVAVVAFAQVCGRPARRVARDVDLEAEMVRVLARGVDGAPVRLAAMYGVVSASPQQVDETRPHVCQIGTFALGYAVAVPLGEGETVIRRVGRHALAQRPVGHAVARGIAPRHEAAARGRAETAGVCLREHNTLPRQTLHVGRLVTVIVEGALAPEGQRGILPPHVVDHEQDDVGAPGRGGRLRRSLLCGRSGKGQRQRQKQSVVSHTCKLFFNVRPSRAAAIKIAILYVKYNLRASGRGLFFCSERYDISCEKSIFA